MHTFDRWTDRPFSSLVHAGIPCSLEKLATGNNSRNKLVYRNAHWHRNPKQSFSFRTINQNMSYLIKSVLSNWNRLCSLTNLFPFNQDSSDRSVFQCGTNEWLVLHHPSAPPTEEKKKLIGLLTTKYNSTKIDDT